jgi:hypothetical protein
LTIYRSFEQVIRFNSRSREAEGKRGCAPVEAIPLRDHQNAPFT